MELHNGIKYGSSIAQAAGTLVGISPDAEGTSRLSETLVPILDLYAYELGELSYLRGEYLVGMARFSAAVAAELSMIAIVNNAVQKMLLVVDRVSSRGSAANTTQLGVTTRAVIAATMTIQNPPIALDTRWDRNLAGGGAFSPAGVEIWAGSDPLSLSSIEEECGPSAEYREAITPPYTLKPGTGLFVQGGTVNIGIGATFRARFRPAMPGEL
jgi:hypothetical protein